MGRIIGLAVATLVGAAACDAGNVEEAPEAETAAEQPQAGEPVAEGGAAGGAAIAVDTLEGVGAYLTDAGGRALYLLEGEPSDSSTCYDACAEVWPPFVAEGGAPQAGAAPVQANLIGTLQRRDGRMQVTYSGHPLYYYAEDRGPGQATGQDKTDRWGEWYLVTPEGQHLEEHGS